MADHQTPAGLLRRSQNALSAQLFDVLECGLDIWHPHIEDRVTDVPLAPTDPTGNACAVTGDIPVHETVLAWLRNFLGHRTAGVESPSEQGTKILAKGRNQAAFSNPDLPGWVPLDLEGHNLCSLVLCAASVSLPLHSH